MKLVLLTTPEKIMSECDSLEHLLELGVDYLHVRKETEEKDYITKLINTLPKKYREITVLHGHQPIAEQYKLAGLHHKSNSSYIDDCRTTFQTKSFHSIEEIKACKESYQYGFLSPIFDSISKPGYQAAFNEDELRKFLNSDEKPFPIIALGGINPSNVQKAKELGFDGVAVLGAVWSKMFLNKKIEVFNLIKENL